MRQASPINRTYHPKYVTYTGDGSGKDHYVVFNNGGLHGLRDYSPSKPKGLSLGPHAPHQGVTPIKDPMSVDYVPDGSGRDLYIIKLHGLKRDYKSGFRHFEQVLRSTQNTPMMDSRQIFRRDQTDATMYNNWPSQSAIKDKIKTFAQQRESIKRLNSSPNRTSPMMKFLTKTATFDINPQKRAQNYMVARQNEILLAQISQRPSPSRSRYVSPTNLNKVETNLANKDELTSGLAGEFNRYLDTAINRSNFQSHNPQIATPVSMEKTNKSALYTQLQQRKQQGEIVQRHQNLTPSNHATKLFGFDEGTTIKQGSAFSTISKGFAQTQYLSAKQNRPNLVTGSLRTSVGHNSKLDQLTGNKIVNNEAFFFK